jgi:hypothetical protein
MPILRCPPVFGAAGRSGGGTVDGQVAVDQDPISELRESLRRRAPTWEPDRPARQVPTFDEPRERARTASSWLPRPRSVLAGSAVARSMLARLRWPHPRIRLDIPWRRGGAALRRLLLAARSFIVALAAAVAVIIRVAARATQRAFRAGVPLVRAAGRALRAAWVRSLEAAARDQERRRERVALRAAARRAAAMPQAVTEVATVEPPPADTIVDVGERHLEELERRQLEQRIAALGPDHPDVAVMLQLVAERCAARGATDEALASYGQALRIQETAFGADSAALGPLLHDLADLERELGHDADALLHEARREMLAPHAAPRTEPSRPRGGRAARTSSAPPSNGSSVPPSNGAMRAH